MKTALFAVLLSVGFSLVASHAFGSDKTCRAQVDASMTVVGRGSSAEAAYEDAATKCFDRLASRHHVRPGESINEDAGLQAIDVCANIRCG